jgi:hypothetical protein
MAMLFSVWRVAVLKNQHLTCFFIVAFLVLCGSILGADAYNNSDHFLQFIHFTGYSKAHRSFLQLIWLLCVWVVWNERNNMLFRNVQTPIDQLLEKVKSYSLWWLKACKATFLCTVIRVGGRTPCYVWVSTDL